MHHRRRPSLLAVALLVAACGSTTPPGTGTPAPALAASPGGAGPAASAVPTPPADPSPSPILPSATVPPTTGEAGIDWRRIQLPGDVATEGWMYDVAAGPAGLVAVGENALGFTVHWTSPDGVTWQRGGKIDFPDGDYHENAYTGDRAGPQWQGSENAMLVGRPDGVVLVDASRDVWTSTDGTDFTGIDRTQTGFGTRVEKLVPGYLQDVTDTGSGLVAVASSGPRDGPSRATQPIVYRSSDGRAWTPSPVAGGVFDLPMAIRTVSVVAGEGDALLLAAREYRYGRPESVRLSAWLTVDGRSYDWERLEARGWPEPLDALLSDGRHLIVGVEEELARDDAFLSPVRGTPVAWLRDGGAWSRIVMPSADDTATMVVPEAVTTFEGGFLAVGWEATRDASRGVAWRSVDGRRWKATALEGPLDGDGRPVRYPDDRARAVTAFEGGLVAVGNDELGAAVWVSGPFAASPAGPDPARDWSSVELPEASAWTSVSNGPAVQGARFDDVIEFDGGYLAVGTAAGGRGGSDAPWRIRPVVWHSADGRAWERQPAGTIPPANRPPDIRDFRATGFRLATDGRHVLILGLDRYAWLSEDGRRWTALDWHASGLRPPVDLHPSRDRLWATTVRDVAGSPDGFVAVGRGCWCHEFSTGDFVATSWTSPDGERWLVSPHVESSMGGAAQVELSAVIRYRDRWVGLGRRLRNGNDDIATWTSTDGRTWRRVTFDARPEEEPGGLASNGSLVVATYGSDGRTAVRTSSDGRSWSGATVLPGDGTPSAVAADAQGFVIAGLVGDSEWDQRLVVWRSTDGASWVRDEPASDSGRSRTVGDVVLTNERIVILGSASRDGELWVGPR
jgi:hypothetical protein